MNLIKFEKWFKSVSKTFALGASQNKHTPFALISDISKNFNFTGGITLVLFKHIFCSWVDTRETSFKTWGPKN